MSSWSKAVSTTITIDEETKKATVVRVHEDGSVVSYDIIGISADTKIEFDVHKNEKVLTVFVKGVSRNERCFINWKSSSIKDRVKNLKEAVKDYIADHGWWLFD